MTDELSENGRTMTPSGVKLLSTKAIFWIGCLVLSPAALAQGAPAMCASPRAALVQWLSNLQPENFKPDNATACFERPDGWSLERSIEASIRLKRHLDENGIFVRLDAAPVEPEHVEAATGLQRYAASASIPELVIIKMGDRWTFPQSVLVSAETFSSSRRPSWLKTLVETGPPWMKSEIFDIAVWKFAGLLALILVGWVMRWAFSIFFLGRVRRLLEKLGLSSKVVVTEQAALPGGLLVMAGLLYIGIPALSFPLGVASVLMVAVRTVAAVGVVLLAYRAIDIVAAAFAGRAERTDTKLDDQLIPILRKTAKFVVVVLGFIFVLKNLQVDVTGLLTGVGLGGLALALAAKDLAMNFLGSITIFTDQQFQIGDWIEVSDVEGVVEEVGFRSTRIRTFYNSVVSVPNGKFIDATVDNYGRRDYRRCKQTLGLTYDTSPQALEAFCKGVRKIIESHPSTRKDAIEVHFGGYGDSALEVFLYFFFEVAGWSDELRAKHEIFLDIMKLASALEVSFAFPTQSLHLETVREPSPRHHLETMSEEDLAGVLDGFGKNPERARG